MKSTAVLADGFARVPHIVRGALAGASIERLTARIDPQANTLAWLAWHIGREQDAQLADLSGTEQVWVTGGWAGRLGIDSPPSRVGYGDTSAQVAQIVAPADGLIAYVDAVGEFAANTLSAWSDDDLDVVIDDSWDPPVTRGVRLISIVDDAVQHGGQAAFLRGLLDRAD